MSFKEIWISLVHGIKAHLWTMKWHDISSKPNHQTKCTIKYSTHVWRYVLTAHLKLLLKKLNIPRGWALITSITTNLKDV